MESQEVKKVIKEQYKMLTNVPYVNLDSPMKEEDFQGRLILLDFWTYCCINCLHAMEDLKDMEKEFGDKLLVIGVHSGKFDTEKDTDQIRLAVEKYDIHHPVANDYEFLLFRYFGAKAWPTFILLGPDGEIIKETIGENVKRDMGPAIREFLNSKDNKILNHSIKTGSYRKTELSLRFPGKIHVDEAGVIVSDTENHRIVIFDHNGNETLRIGSGLPGFEDGSLSHARFRSPQGITRKGHLLYVADTGNHSIRLVNLQEKIVHTLYGTGIKSSLSYWDHIFTNELNSPWDVEFQNNDLMIAMAGSHQIYKINHAGKLEHVAGSGLENILDDSTDQSALAQTSGLSVFNNVLYFIDSETSSLRLIKEDRIKTLAGTGLFQFGLKDGLFPESKMQHPLGLYAGETYIYIADTYNHAIRRYNRKTGILSTLAGGKKGKRDGSFKNALFNEPNDVFLYKDNLYVTDTNNHNIRIMDLKQQTVKTFLVKFNKKIEVNDQ